MQPQLIPFYLGSSTRAPTPTPSGIPTTLAAALEVPASAPAGVSRALPMTIVDPSALGTPAVAGFDGTEGLAAVAWPGGDLGAAFTPSVAWADAPAASVVVAVSGADTAGLEPGRYRLRCSVTPSDGLERVFYDATLTLVDSPGARETPSALVTYRDLRRFAPWVDKLLDPEADYAGFLDERARASGWLKEVIVAHYKPIRWAGPALGSPGSGAYYGSYQNPSPAPSRWLRDQLDAGRLIVREPTTEIVARYALYLICSDQVGAKDDDAYIKQGLRNGRMAEALAAAYTAELDLDGDGWPDLWIACGSGHVR